LTVLLSAMFLLGAFALQAQVFFSREALVVFYGNELALGAVLGTWLLGIALGACAARAGLPVWTRGGRPDRLRYGILLGMSALLPGQAMALRTARAWLDVPVGEYAPLGAILSAGFLLFLPTALGVGFYFPLACHALAGRAAPGARGASVGRIYMAEALGSMAGGMVLTFVLLPRLNAVGLVASASLTGFLAACCAAPAWRGRRAAALLCAVPLAVLLWPGLGGWLNAAAERARWRAFGVLGDRTGIRLVAAHDSRYQNLALIESGGQYTLFANGDVAAVFPDPIEDEHTMHFIMAQKPDARSVLLLGGNPAGAIPELLKYPVERVVCVTLDPAAGELIRRAAPGAYRALRDDPRVTLVNDDGPRFVRRCRERFDAVLVDAPEPGTAAENRAYTVEFFAMARGLLRRGGFLTTTVQGSERLQDDAARVGASVYRSLRAVFPVVLITAGTPNRFYAGDTESGLTLDRETLRARSASIPRADRYFRPVYFLGTDDLDPEKCAFVVRRFREVAAPLNTGLRPAATYHALVLWTRLSSSLGEALLRRARLVRAPRWAGGLILAGAAACAAGLALRRRTGARRAWMRAAVTAVVATTGFCGMALELVLVFLFQSALGYVYARMGLVFAVFMLGLTLGARTGSRAALHARRAFAALLGLEALMLSLALAIPLLARPALCGAPGFGTAAVEWGIYALVWLVGWTVGAEFALGNVLYRAAGGSLAGAAAVTDAADHVGAAFGALVIGVVLIPVLGITASCVLLAALKGFGLLLLAGAGPDTGNSRAA
jgi:spermidine synthase